ncbi:hypothetical protein LINPERPRIM_LOCUS8688, partial [Linum perenne]
VWWSWVRGRRSVEGWPTGECWTRVEVWRHRSIWPDLETGDKEELKKEREWTSISRFENGEGGGPATRRRRLHSIGEGPATRRWRLGSKRYCRWWRLGSKGRR